ncbi:MAG TPA: hypothetical protein VGF75_03010 [Candidatus Saccharimonadales bacterium]|jgi:hypothetical protein
MSSPGKFIFKYYIFDSTLKTLELKYEFDGGMEFTETYYFDFTFASYDDNQLARALEHLLLIAGVSYFKAYVPDKIEISKGSLTSEEAEFYSKTYEMGLGEFWYVNKLDPKTKISFPVSSSSKKPIEGGAHEGLLVGIGGGKDSLVTVEALKRANQEFMTWSLNHRQQLEPLIKTIGSHHAYVERTIDPRLLELNDQGAYNGHVPFSAILASVGVVVAILSGKRDVVVSNEQAANEPTLKYQGVDINHQYSKSQQFERDFQKLVKNAYGDSIRYYSFLRPLSELYIAEIFAKLGFDKYKSVFSSCNRAYTLHSDHMFWCGECPKCAFVFMILTPFIERKKLEALWGGKNLLLDPSLVETYKNLLGISGEKPLDCVGEIKEVRAAMRMCFKTYPELEKEYEFDLPGDYDYKALAKSEMPSDIQKVFDEFMASQASPKLST